MWMCLILMRGYRYRYGDGSKGCRAAIEISALLQSGAEKQYSLQYSVHLDRFISYLRTYHEIVHVL
jgi:hypothetical protein